MRSIQHTPSLLALIFFPTVFLFGACFDLLGLKLVAFSVMCLGMYLILITPIRWALFSLFIYVGFEGFFKVVSNYHPVIHVGSDLLVITLTLKTLVIIFFEGVPEGKLPPLTKLFLLHFLWLGIVFFNPYSLSFLSNVAGSKIYISMFLLYYYGYYNVHTLKDVRFFMIPFIIVGAVHTITGLVQGFTGPEALLAMHPRYAVQLMKYQTVAFRPFGMTNLPGGPSVYLYQTFPFVLYFLIFYRSLITRILLTAYLPLATALFFLCQVRSALFKMILASAIFIFGAVKVFASHSSRSFQRIVFITTSIGVLLYFLLPRFFEYSVEMRQDNEMAIERSLTLFDYDNVSNSRRGALNRFLQYSSEVPFGAGFARVGAAAGAFKDLHHNDKIFGFKYFFADNFWLTALIEVGIPGMLIITALLLLILYRGFRDFFKSRLEQMQLVYMAILAPLVALAVGLYGAEGLIYNPEACFFWFFAGVLLKLRVIEGNMRQEKSSSV